MRSIFFLISTVLLCSTCLAEVLELKSGDLLRGEIVDYTDEKIKFKVGEMTRIVPMKDIAPSTVYKLRSERIDDSNAQSHIELADYCIDNALFEYAKIELKTALELNSTLSKAVQDRLTSMQSRHAEFLLARGQKSLSLLNYDRAIDDLSRLVELYPSSAQAEQAKASIKAATEAVAKENDAKKRKLDELQNKKQQENLTKLEENIKQRFVQAEGLINQATISNARALDFETETQLSKAERTWVEALASLDESKKILQELLLSSSSPDGIKMFNEKIVLVDSMTVRIYTYIANLWLFDGNYTESIRWINKALAMSPNDDFALKLKFKITDLKLQKTVKPMGSTGVIQVVPVTPR